MLNQEQLTELVDALEKELLGGKLLELVASFNRKGKLLDWLKEMGLEQLLAADVLYNPSSMGKIVVLGASAVDERILYAIGKKYGLSKSRFEFFLDYKGLKTFKYDKLRNHNKYAAIIVGPMPHSTTATGNYRSAISAMENGEDFPPVFRVEKISNAAFNDVLNRMILDNTIAA